MCANKFEGKFYRVVVEDVLLNGVLEVFFVDTGHRLKTNISDCFELPDRYL